MYFLSEMCCICMSKNDLKLVFDVDNDGVSHYNKLTSSIAEMEFKEMNKQRFICRECCINLNTVYHFRQKCLRSKKNLISYISQLETYGKVSGKLSVCLIDIKPKMNVPEEVMYIKCEKEDSEEENNSQPEFLSEHCEDENFFPTSVKEECESEEEEEERPYNDEEPAIEHVNEKEHSEVVKAEPIDTQALMEVEFYIIVNDTDTAKDPLAVENQVSTSNAETPRDVSSGSTRTSAESTSGTSIISTEHKLKADQGSETHACEICEKSFNELEDLTKHMRVHPAEKLCNEFEGDLYEESKKKDSESDSQEESEEIGFECQKCKKLFMYKYHLDLHMQVHSNEKFVCEYCHRVFFHKREHTEHVRKHTGERPFECPECKKTYARKKHLSTHMRSHLPEKPYKCEVCGKGYSQKNNLKSHMRSHTGESLHTCEVCNRSFNNTGNFKHHLQIHSGERPHECEICNKSFTQKGTLVKHMLMHSDERPHKCNICHRGFVELRRLKKHLRTHVPIEKFECKICQKKFIKQYNLAKHELKHLTETPK